MSAISKNKNGSTTCNCQFGSFVEVKKGQQSEMVWHLYLIPWCETEPNVKANFTFPVWTQLENLTTKPTCICEQEKVQKQTRNPPSDVRKMSYWICFCCFPLFSVYICVFLGLTNIICIFVYLLTIWCFLLFVFKPFPKFKDSLLCS